MTSRQRALYRRLRGGAGVLRRRLARRPRPQQTPHAHHRLAAPEGRTPDVGLETTNVGPVMDDAVLRARRRMRIGADADYDLLYESFDVLHYLLQSPRLLERLGLDRPDADEPGPDPIEHFLENGLPERLSPHPDFSMEAYVARYPRKATAGPERSPYLRWLKRGKAAGEVADPAPGIGPMAHVLGLPPQQVVDLVAERRRDLQRRFQTGRLGEMFARAAEVEPLIGATWPETTRPKLLPLSRPGVVSEVSAIYRAQEAAGFRRARLVLVTDRAQRHGGRGMEGHLAHALATHVDPDDIVVIHTGRTAQPPGVRYPEGVRQVDFARIARNVQREDTQHALVMLLRAFGADAIVNVGSAMLYQAMQTYDRALAATERLFLALSGNEPTPMGTWDGTSLRYFYRTFDHVAGVITDGEYLARELTATYRLPQGLRERLHVLREPVDPALPVAAESPARTGRRAQVFWAGHWSRRGRVDLLLRVAGEMPDVDFRLWPEQVPDGVTGRVPPNVSVEGRYGGVSAVPLAEADVWLYTPGWPGVPGRLLEVAVTGVPIVGSLVGGTDEVLGDLDAWPVAEAESAQAHVEAIRAALADPADARRRALALRERLLKERGPERFAEQAAALLLADHDAGEGGR